MAEVSPRSESERRLLGALLRHKVRFLVVGLSAAALQGAPVVTQDIDLRFEDLSDPSFAAALREVGAAYRKAFEGFDRALELDLFELQHLALGESVWGNHEEAFRFARASIDLAPDKVAAGNFNLGYCLMRAGRYREAIDAFLEVLPAWEGADKYGFLGQVGGAGQGFED